MAFVRICVRNKVSTVFHETIKQSRFLLPCKVSTSLQLVVMVSDLPLLSGFLVFCSMPCLVSVEGSKRLSVMLMQLRGLLGKA